MASIGREVFDAYRYHSMLDKLAKGPGYVAPICPPLIVHHDDELTQPAFTEPPQAHDCPNAMVRADMWLDNPSIRVSDPGIDFLTRLAQHCIESKIRDCKNEQCAHSRKSMDEIAPACNWKAFRDWALTSIACQSSLDPAQRLTRVNTHIARAVSGCSEVLNNCCSFPESLRNRFDGGPPSSKAEAVDLFGVINMIYWMITIQAAMGVGPSHPWNHDSIPAKVVLPAIEAAVQKIQRLGICPQILWNVVALGERRQSELPQLVAAIEGSPVSLHHEGHDFCSPGKCQYSHMNSTNVRQLHKCEIATTVSGVGALRQDELHNNCVQSIFPVDLLEPALDLGRLTAWSCSKAAPRLAVSGEPYIAISHVWSDGTGVGVGAHGAVNDCLFRYFGDIAEKLECTAIWWDALSIPLEPRARSKAMNNMHTNYAMAAYMVVHDTHLLRLPWTDAATACIALVLSPWFTRGWTALELAVSRRVKVLFDGGKEIRDLDDILAASPAKASRAHWLASSLIQLLRSPVTSVRDLLAILRPRSTSWVRDRTIIAGLLARVPQCDYSRDEGAITRDIIVHMGSVPFEAILHGVACMYPRGGFSWCPPTLDDMPVERTADLDSDDDDPSEDYEGDEEMVSVDDRGVATGWWSFRPVNRTDIERGRLQPHGNDLAATVRIQGALRRWRNCILLQHDSSETSPRLLAVPIAMGFAEDGLAIIDCRFVGVVREIGLDNWGKGGDGENKTLYTTWIRLGSDGVDDSTEKQIHGEKVVHFVVTESSLCPSDSEDDSGSDTGTLGDEEKQPKPEKSLIPGETGERLKHLTQARNISRAIAQVGSNSVAGIWISVGDDNVKIMDTPTVKDLQNPTPKAHTLESGTDSVTGPGPDSLGEDEATDEEPLLWYQRRDVQRYQRPTTTECNVEEARSQAQQGEFSPDTTSMEIKANHLFFAVRDEVEPAARHLVSQGVDLLPSMKANLEKFIDPDEVSTPSNLRMLARVYLEAGKLEDANDMLQRAILGLVQLEGPRHRDTLKAIYMQARVNLKWNRPAKAESLLRKVLTLHEQASVRPRPLWLGASTDLALMLADQNKIDDAAAVYRSVLDFIGSPPLPTGFGTGRVPAFIDDQADLGATELDDVANSDTSSEFLYQCALRVFERELGSDHSLTPVTVLNLAAATCVTRANLDEAEQLAMRSQEGLESQLTHMHMLALRAALTLARIQSLQGKADEAERTYRQAMLGFEKRFGPKHQYCLHTALELGRLCRRRGRLGEAEKLCRRAMTGLKRGRVASTGANVAALYATSELGKIYSESGRITDAENLFQEAISGLRLAESPGSCRASNDMVSLGTMYEGQGRLQDAEQMFKEVIDNEESTAQGSDDLVTLKAAGKLGQLYMKQKKLEEAENILRRAFTGLNKTLGPYHPPTLEAATNLGVVCWIMHKLDKAVEMLSRALSGYKRTLGPQDETTLQIVHDLGRLYLQQSKLRQSEEMYRQALRGLEKSFGLDDIRSLQVVQELGDLYIRLDDQTEAEGMHRRIFHGFLTTSPISALHARMVSLCRLADLHITQGKLGEVHDWVHSALRHCQVSLGSKDTTTLLLELSMGRIYRAEGRQGEAEKMIQRASDEFDHVLGPDHVTTLNAVVNLGYLRMDQGRLEEAELLIERAVNGFRTSFGAEHLSALYALHSLGFIYIGLGKTKQGEEALALSRGGFEKQFDPDQRPVLRLVMNLNFSGLCPDVTRLRLGLDSLSQSFSFNSPDIGPRMAAVICKRTI